LAQASSSLNTNFCIYLWGESTYLHCKLRNTGCTPIKDLSKIMTEDEILSEFRAAEALLEGHFLLSSGRHSAYYLQCARLLMNPERASRVAVAIAQKLPRDIRSQIDIVVSPAMGGIIIGHEMGRALGVDALFVERPEGVFGLRRGFALKEGQKVLMVEDVVTTGLSSREAIKAIEDAGGEVIAAASIVDRSAGSVDLGVPFFPLIELNFPTYAPDELPPELAATEAVKPGSRKA
jgi:orotate phosphoribosyltransferase